MQWKSIPANERSGQQAGLLRKRVETKNESAQDVKMVRKEGREDDTAVEATTAIMIVNAAIVGTGGVEVAIKMLERTETKIDPGRDAEIGMGRGRGNTVTDAIAMAIEGKVEKEVTDETEMEAGSVAARDRETDAGAAVVLSLIAETEEPKSSLQQRINRTYDTHRNTRGVLTSAMCYEIDFEINS